MFQKTKSYKFFVLVNLKPAALWSFCKSDILAETYKGVFLIFTPAKIKQKSCRNGAKKAFLKLGSWYFENHFVFETDRIANSKFKK